MEGVNKPEGYVTVITIMEIKVNHLELRAAMTEMG